MADPQDPDKPVLTYKYRFAFPNGVQKEFAVRLDETTLQQIQEPRQSYPQWTALTHQQCENCPLKAEESPQCPAAASLADAAAEFSSLVSYEEVDVTIETEARRYTKRTTVQKGLSSLVGLYMVTSGCPVMGKLRPMVRQHLPFANLTETVYRVLSMYLLAQFLLARKGRAPDWKLEKLVELYKSIHVVNRAFSQRLVNVVEGDANLNALAILDIFAQTVTFALDEDMLHSLEQMFQPYFDE